MDTPPPPPRLTTAPPMSQTAGGMLDAIGQAFHGPGWADLQERQAAANAAADQHGAELRRLELIRAKADAVQAITSAVMIMALGTTGLVLLLIAVAKLATL